MNVARVTVAGVAIAAGLLALMLSGGRNEPVPQMVQNVMPQVEKTPMSEVLVATTDIAVGGSLNSGNLTWRNWPDEAIGAHFIRKSSKPEALTEMKGAISRFPLTSGEAVMESRIIKMGDHGGFMAAMLAQGMRAIAVPITAETGAGGFILPNDRVDVLLTRRERSSGQQQERFISETILTSVRVMAIDQTIQERDGEKVVVGRTATLELSSEDSETIALSKQSGELSLALRSIADSKEKTNEPTEPRRNQNNGSVTIVRFGVPAQTPLMSK